MKQMLIYDKVVPVTREAHGKLSLKPTGSYEFARQTNSVPLVVGEFGLTAMNYAIVFGQAADGAIPAAILGARDAENVFVAADGSWSAPYIPAFIRRYPFVGALDEAAQKMVVCIDRGSSLWIEGGGDVPLFENGQATEFTKSCIEFCSQFDADRRQTDIFIKLLNDLDLFETRQTSFTPRTPDGLAGEPQVVAEFFGISEERLKALPVEKFAELHANGALGQVYAHMISLFGWDRLITESLGRRAEQAPQDA